MADRGGATFEFPRISSCRLRYVVLIEFNPAKNPEKAARLAKRQASRKGSDPWPVTRAVGQGGDTVSLYKPDPHRAYNRGRRFRSIHPRGPSHLQRHRTLAKQRRRLGRHSATDFRHSVRQDPVNWKAAAPNPGRANRSTTLDDTDADGMPDEGENPPLVLTPTMKPTRRQMPMVTAWPIWASTSPAPTRGDSASALRLATQGLVNGKLSMVFEASPGRLFEIQSTPALAKRRGNR
ncbi:MAG: hypothetical protein Ct9H300mP7_3930 [Verrucomicrobiota bacterium]|nr:MAG: hypothetical protein Ct9H300mP7_3930 [Verrucomicrobiota bacterium]